MAEIVWPSELYDPYQLDTDNPDTTNLTSCTYDDGATVHDIVNGGTTTFDTANQIGTTAPVVSAYRLHGQQANPPE